MPDISPLHSLPSVASPLYAFPGEAVANLTRYQSLPTAEVLEWFRDVAEKYDGPLRTHHCVLNLVLADRGIAPAFRGITSGVTRATGLTPQQQDESNDRQVHDLYWLHRTYRAELNPARSAMRELFQRVEFDFQLASEVVRTTRRTDDKLRYLGIPPSIQVELFTLKSRGVRALSRTYQEKSRRVEIALRERARRPRGRITVADIPTIMGELTALDLAGGSPTGAAVFLSHMTGCAVTEQLVWRLSKRRDWFRKAFGVLVESKLAPLALAGLSHEECEREVELRQSWFALKKTLASSR